MEEDIKILEEFIEDYENEEFVTQDRVMRAIENLIARNKELEQNYINPSKAKFSYYDTGKGTKVVIEGFIPKSKIRELLKEIDEINSDEGWWYENKLKKLLED